jgi:hypothetical protein
VLLHARSKATLHAIDYESVEGRSGNDPHFLMILCSRFGSKHYPRHCRVVAHSSVCLIFAPRHGVGEESAVTHAEP